MPDATSTAGPIVALNARNCAKRAGRRIALLAMYPVADPAMPERISNFEKLAKPPMC